MEINGNIYSVKQRAATGYAHLKATVANRERVVRKLKDINLRLLMYLICLQI